MGIPDHLTCLLRNLYVGQEATVRTGHGTTDWFQLGKQYVKAVYCHPAHLTYMQGTSWETLGWMKHKLESRLPGEISVPQICRWHHPYGRKWRTKKSLLMKVKEESENVGLKLSIPKTKIMASGPITSWQIDGKNGNSERLHFLGVQNHCRWWLQARNWKLLVPWKESYDQPRQHIKKQRHYLPTKVHLVKAMFFF